jgi:hypothetical protein
MSKSSDQTSRLTQLTGNNTLLHGIQFTEQRFRETFSGSNSTRRYISEEDAVQNMPRNNDEDEDDENNVPNNPPPMAPTGAGPTYRTFEGNFTKHDKSVRTTNISSYNAEGNTVKNSFIDNPYVGSSRT